MGGEASLLGASQGTPLEQVHILYRNGYYMTNLGDGYCPSYLYRPAYTVDYKSGLIYFVRFYRTLQTNFSRLNIDQPSCM